MDSRSGRSFFAVSPARGFQPPRGVPHMFVHVHKEFVLFCVHHLFFIAFNKFLSII